MSGRPLQQPGSTIMARLAAPTTSHPTRLAVVADPHVATRATGSPKQFGRTESLLESTIKDINSRDVDAVISVGDLTKDGAPWDFDRVDELLEELSAPFFAVPGNHDVPKTFNSHRSASRGRFIDQYTPGKLPYHVQVGGVDLFGLDSAWTPTGDLRDSHDGRITSQQLEWLTSRTETADCPVVFTHHNLPPTAKQAEAYGETAGIDMSGVPIMRNGEEVMAALEAAGVRLVVTGHIHLPGVATNVTPLQQEESTPAKTAVTANTDITEITSPATCTYPQAYLLVDVDSRGTTVRYIPIASAAESAAAYNARLAGTDIDRGQAALGAIRTAQFPLVEDWVPTRSPILMPTTALPSGSPPVDN